MIPLLAAIPSIITAVGKVTDLFKKGKETVETVTGAPSTASTPDEMQVEIQNLSPEQQNRWAEIMTKEIDRYVAENERLSIEIGLVDQNITGNLSQEASSDIAIMRMTTRPWAVRWMVWYVLFPFVLVVVDIVQHLLVTWLPFLKRWIEPFNTFEYVFGVMKIPENADAGVLNNLIELFKETGGPTTFAGDLYMQSIPWVVSIILGYMGLREIGKAKGHADRDSGATIPSVKPSAMTMVGRTISQGAGLVSNITNWFKKKK